MKPSNPPFAQWITTAIALISAQFTVGAATRYVWQGSPSPGPPYTNWATAAHTIQDAVDAAQTNDLVLVTNGVYATGGRVVHGTMTNRLAVDKPLLVQSVNGPEHTIIEGAGSTRCCYLTSNAVLSGFTMTNGATRSAGDYARERSGGGVWCESVNAVVINCVLAGNSAFNNGGGAYRGTLNDCTLTANSADCGGGACGSTLNHCSLTGNYAIDRGEGLGGGADASTLNHCTLTGNSAPGGGGASCSTLNACTLTGNSAGGGGGTLQGTLNNCVLTDNWAGTGGGAWGGTLNHCTLTDNTATWHGGGSLAGTLNNCVLTDNGANEGGGASGYCDYYWWHYVRVELNNCALINNWADNGGGGVHLGTLNNCTVTGNSADGGAGGASAATLNNSIVYYNSTGSGFGANYDDSSTLNNCCTTPVPTNSVGNLTNAPLFVDTNGWSNLRLQPGSPCINAGNNDCAVGDTDLDGNPRILGVTVDMGAYEFVPPTPAELVEQLIALVNDSDLRKKRPLLASLGQWRRGLDGRG